MLFNENIAYALGWTVVHSLWQGLIVGVVVALLFWGLRDEKSNTRYIIGLFGLMMMVLASIITFLGLYESREILIGDTQLLLIDTVSGSSHAVFNTISRLEIYVSEHIRSIAIFWSVGVLFFGLKLMGSYAYILYIRRHGTFINNSRLLSIFERMRSQLNLSKSIKLATSEWIHSPIVMGWLKPVILFPIGWINQLSTKELEAVLAHELAHIHRLDYLANLLQSVVEVLFYYHPIVWWLSAKVRLERESSCDEVAVSLAGSSLDYAKALVALQNYAKNPPVAALAFAGKKELLLLRIQRLLNHPQNKSRIMEKLMVMSLIVVMLFSMSVKGKELQPEEEMLNMEAAAVSENTIATTAFQAILTDTIPKKKKKVVVEEDNRTISVKMEDGEITELRINGEEIAPGDYHLYEREIADMKKGHQAGYHMEVKTDDEGNEEKYMEIFVDPDTDDVERIEVIKDGDRKVMIVQSDEDIQFDGDSIIIRKIKRKRKVKGNKKRKKLKKKEIGSDGVSQMIIVSPDVDEMEVTLQEMHLDEEKMMKLEKEMEERMAIAMEKANLSQQQMNELMEEYDLLLEDELKLSLENAGLELQQAGDKLKDLQHTGFEYVFTDLHPLKTDWLQYLIDNKLIMDKHNYKVRFTEKSLRINGQKQAPNVLNQCLQLYKEQYGFPMNRKNRIVIENRE